MSRPKPGQCKCRSRAGGRLGKSRPRADPGPAPVAVSPGGVPDPPPKYSGFRDVLYSSEARDRILQKIELRDTGYTSEENSPSGAVFTFQFAHHAHGVLSGISIILDDYGAYPRLSGDARGARPRGALATHSNRTPRHRLRARTYCPRHRHFSARAHLSALSLSLS